MPGSYVDTTGMDFPFDGGPADGIIDALAADRLDPNTLDVPFDGGPYVWINPATHYTYVASGGVKFGVGAFEPSAFDPEAFQTVDGLWAWGYGAPPPTGGVEFGGTGTTSYTPGADTEPETPPAQPGGGGSALPAIVWSRESMDRYRRIAIDVLARHRVYRPTGGIVFSGSARARVQYPPPPPPEPPAILTPAYRPDGLTVRYESDLVVVNGRATRLVKPVRSYAYTGRGELRLSPAGQTALVPISDRDLMAAILHGGLADELLAFFEEANAGT